LLVGGVLVGQDLISAAAIRSQISQIEKYQTAVLTFKSKYGYLPGDMPDPQASQFGFIARAHGGVGLGSGDGNGYIDGVCFNTWNGTQNDNCSIAGEQAALWNDLSTAKLIDGIL